MKIMGQIEKIRMGLALPVALVMAVAGWGATTESVSYVDADGSTKSQSCTLLSTVSDVSNLSTGCYVVDDNLSYTQQVATKDGDLVLILADGKTLTVNKNGNDALVAGSEGIMGSTTMKNLTIYGQEKQTGSMVLSGKGGTVYSTVFQTGRGIHAKDLVINGGVISVTSESSDGIYVTGNVTINGGSVSVSTSSGTHNGLKGDAINLSWRNLTDYVKVSSFSGVVNVSSGKAFKDGSGNIYNGGTTLSPSQKSTLENKYLMPYAPVVFVDGKAVIDGNYTGSVAVNIPNAIEASSIDYQREFTVDVPATVVLPFSLPAGTTTNAEFFKLDSVYQKGCAWRASMTNIGADVLPTANTPYAVKLKSGSRLTFNLPANAKATFWTQQGNPIMTVPDGKWFFAGTYSYKTWGTDNDDVRLGFVYGFAGSNEQQIAKGKFGKIALDASDPTKVPYVNPLRAYLSKSRADVKLNCMANHPAALGKSAADISSIPEIIEVDFNEYGEIGERTTFVGRMNTRTGEFLMIRDYDLKGRKLNGAPAARGAYYGKKVIKK